MNNIKIARELRNTGIERSITTANSACSNWADKAYEVLLKYMETNTQFMTEDVRKFSESTLEIPPSTRAWGGIVVKACKEGLIERIGFQSVKNPRAHMTPATIWKVV